MKQQSGLGRVLRASAIRIASIVLGLLASVVIARLGGADVKGVASAYAAANALAFLVVNLDLAQQVLRHGRETNALALVPIKIVGLWPAYLVLAIVAAALLAPWEPSASWIAMGAFVYLISTQIGMIANALAGPSVAALGALIQQSAMALLAAGFGVASSLDSTSVRIVVLGSYLAPMPLYWAQARRRRQPLPAGEHRLDLRSILRLARAGLRWQVARLAQFLMLRLDLLVVFATLGAAAAGTYSIGLATAGLAGIVPAIFAQNATYEATVGAGHSLRRNVVRAAWSGLLASGVLCAVGYPAVVLAYGAEFSAAYLVLVLASPGIVAYGVVQVFTAHMRLVGVAATVTVPSVIGLIVMAGGLALLVAPFGVKGAAVASSLGPMGAMFAMVALLHRERSRRSRRRITPTVERPSI